MGQRHAIGVIAFLLIFTLSAPALADNFKISVGVKCDDTFAQELIKGNILKELRNIEGVTIVEKGKDPQLELMISGVKTNDGVALSVAKIQHMWSQKVNPNTGKYDHVIFRADHYVAVIPREQINQACSDIVTEFYATYIESLRRK